MNATIVWTATDRRHPVTDLLADARYLLAHYAAAARGRRLSTRTAR